jgi:RNA polymerase sigma factor (sigma-70 family)
MMKTSDLRSLARQRTVVAAVVLGAACWTALGPEAAKAAAPDPQVVADISRYCTACWRNARLPVDFWNDCTQEVLARLLQTIPAPQWTDALRGEGEERRELVRAIDAVKKRTQRSRSYAPLADEVPDRAGRDRRDEWEAVDKAAASVLSPRQQRIVQLSRDGWSIPEIAGELNTSPERVSDEKYKAIRKLRVYFGTDC